MPEEDIAWKYLLVSVETVTFAFIYFEHTIGLQRKNMHLIHKLNFLRDRGKRSIITCGDFNVTPQECEESGLLEILDCRILTTGPYETCRVGNNIIDYIIVSADLVPIL